MAEEIKAYNPMNEECTLYIHTTRVLAGYT